jgi:hypothetical protein
VGANSWADQLGQITWAAQATAMFPIIGIYEHQEHHVNGVIAHFIHSDWPSLFFFFAGSSLPASTFCLAICTLGRRLNFGVNSFTPYPPSHEI